MTVILSLHHTQKANYSVFMLSCHEQMCIFCFMLGCVRACSLQVMIVNVLESVLIVKLGTSSE